jgi:hypothetical protein
MLSWRKKISGYGYFSHQLASNGGWRINGGSGGNLRLSSGVSWRLMAVVNH